MGNIPVGFCHSSGVRKEITGTTWSPVVGEIDSIEKKMEHLLTTYAEAIDEMYENRTRGDYSSLGILSSFLRDVDRARIEFGE